MEFDPGFVFMGLFALVVGTFLIKIIKHGGFKGAMFGASLGRTVGEVACARGKFSSMVIRVHTLEGDADKAIGLELVTKAPLSYQMTPFSLSDAEAKKLISLLESAVRGR